jgi:hypothetical protein
MGALMICCPATGNKISLGVEIDPVSFDRTPDFVAAFYCASCAVNHLWSKTDAWIAAADFKRSTRKRPESLRRAETTRVPVLACA